MNRVIILILLLLTTSICLGAGGSSIIGQSAYITYKHVYTCDSAIAYFGLAATPFDTVKLTPYSTSDSSFLVGSLSLDSLGAHIVWINYYQQGASSVTGHGNGIWTVDSVASSGGTASGGGTEPETLIVMDDSDSTLIEGAKITIKTLDQSTVKVDGLFTDVNGKRILELDEASFFISIKHNNYSKLGDTLTVVSGGDTDTLWMSAFDPGNASDTSQTRVYGWVIDYEGDALEDATVTAAIPYRYWPVKLTSNDRACKARGSTTTDADGYWTIDLYANSLLTAVGDLSSDSTYADSTSRYQFIIEHGREEILNYESTVPTDSTWQCIDN